MALERERESNTTVTLSPHTRSPELSPCSSFSLFLSCGCDLDYFSDWKVRESFHLYIFDIMEHRGRSSYGRSYPCLFLLETLSLRTYDPLSFSHSRQLWILIDSHETTCRLFSYHFKKKYLHSLADGTRVKDTLQIQKLLSFKKNHAEKNRNSRRSPPFRQGEKRHVTQGSQEPIDHE